MQNYRTRLSDKTHAFAHERSLIGRPRIEQGRATLTNSGAGELPITANATAWPVVRSPE
jgi:hypothetical protein